MPDEDIRPMVFLLLPGIQGAIAEGSIMETPANSSILYIYELPNLQGEEAYDHAMAAATLQGIINRQQPLLYILSPWSKMPAHWLEIFGSNGGWLDGRPREKVESLDNLAALAGDRLKGAVIWDPDVPATVNVATTIAGVEDAVVLSPALADSLLSKWGAPIVKDLRGMFDGSKTGSAKNDAYRWAIDEYIRPGRCSAKFLCLYEDAHDMRAQAGTAYVVTRDWSVMNRAFVYDLSPWADEVPADDESQKLGTDRATYAMMLEATMEQAAGRNMTEVAGFFAFQKYSNIPGHQSAHEPVPTEWETVHLISPYNCYQNTVASACYNQSLHSKAPIASLKQQPRPEAAPGLEPKAYICFLMADYDSATPLYEFLPNHWADPRRGEMPFAWGINPSLLDTYPDVIEYFYKTATPNDFFASDASAAGYMNPNRIEPKYLDLFVNHNRHYFQRAGMTMAPMVLDWDEPTPAVKDAFTQFAPDGFATIVMDLHQQGGKAPEPHVWKGMPVLELLNHTCNYQSAEQTVEAMHTCIRNRKPNEPGFFFFRIVWVPPTVVLDAVEAYRKTYPESPIEVLDPYTFFGKAKGILWPEERPPGIRQPLSHPLKQPGQRAIIDLGAVPLIHRDLPDHPDIIQRGPGQRLPHPLDIRDILPALGFEDEHPAALVRRQGGPAYTGAAPRGGLYRKGIERAAVIFDDGLAPAQQP